jgi:hypothetical protein
LGLASGLVALVVVALPALADEIRGTVKSVDARTRSLIVTDEASRSEVAVQVTPRTAYEAGGVSRSSLRELKPGMHVAIQNTVTASKIAVESPWGANQPQRSILAEFWHNFTHNLFKPLLLFFYLGFLVPIFRVKFEFPYAVYQALTIYLLLAIGWHGGEELSLLERGALGPVVGFMIVGFITNFVIGIVAYVLLSTFTRLRQVDKATVAGFYGSDSAGTFVTCLGVLGTIGILHDAYMPVMLAVMEIPGCLVALYLVSRLRHEGMDPAGNMPYEPGYDAAALGTTRLAPVAGGGHGGGPAEAETLAAAVEPPSESTPQSNGDGNGNGNGKRAASVFNSKLLHEVFLNSGLYLLFGGIAIGFISGVQGKKVTQEDDRFFVSLFQGVLCLFLLEMGMTASRKLRDLRLAGWRFVAFGLVAPNLFACLGIVVARGYSMLSGIHLELGTYVLFAVLCGAASYIAVPAVQRMAIPEASPTLPLAASLGLTFSYNVTVGIPIYIEIAKLAERISGAG